MTQTALAFGNSIVPVWASVHLTHAALQSIADSAAVDVLHIKGPTDAALRPGIHDSTDADVLVRPDHLARLLQALERTGWSLYSGFEEGSPFGHAANYEHSIWSWVDVHRAIPGFTNPPAAVFDALWQEREQMQIAHWPCNVLSPRAQVLVQVMHVARSHGRDTPETWQNSPDQLRMAVRALADELGAGTPLAAGIGELALHRDAADYALWKYWSEPNDERIAEWSARLRAANDVTERLRIIALLVRVNRTHLRLRLGHEPSTSEILHEQLARIRKGAASLIRGWTKRRRHRRDGPTP